MGINETVSYFTRMLTAPEIMAGGVTGASIGVTGANTGATIDVTDANADVTGATVVGASGVMAPTRVAGANGVPWVADVTRGTVVPFGLDVVLLAVTAEVGESTGVASTGMWDMRTISIAISRRGTSMRTVPSIAFLALARRPAC